LPLALLHRAEASQPRRSAAVQRCVVQRCVVPARVQCVHWLREVCSAPRRPVHP
jgi:hypothetical protein